MPGLGTFHNRDVELTLTGRSQRNGQDCAVIEYRAYFNPLEIATGGMTLKVRSHYWGLIWVFLTRREVEYATLYEDVLGELKLRGKRWRKSSTSSAAEYLSPRAGNRRRHEVAWRGISGTDCVPARRAALVHRFGAGDAFFADDKLTYGMPDGKAHCVDYTIAALEKKLDPKKFARIHRGTLVNVSWIKEVSSLPGGGLSVRLKDAKGTDLTLARDRAREFKARLCG
jgi:hypothetical protein